MFKRHNGILEFILSYVTKENSPPPPLLGC